MAPAGASPVPVSPISDAHRYGGLRRILFSIRPEAEARAIDEYLKSLEPVRSPALADEELSASAKRGRKVFEGAGCMSCHPEGLFTDLKSHDVGTQGPQGKGEGVHAEARRRGEAEGLDTPTLVEVWRTAPYLHDGSAATLEEVFTKRNPGNRHGHTSKLKAREIEDLCSYIRSL